MHRGRSSPGPPSASMWWLGGAPTRGPRRSRIVFVGDGDEAPDGGPPLVELLRSRREVEEQLRARQSFCWRGWRRQLRGPWRASTSNHVRRSSITAQRLRAIFASTSAGMLASFVPQMMHRALPTAVPRVTGVVTLLVAHTMGRARSGRRRGRLGGCCAARGWHNDTPGGPRAACGGPSSVFGSGDVRPVVWRANDAARQALTARAMLVLADRGPGPVRDRSTARPHRHGPFGSQRADRRGRLLLRSHGDEELLG